MVRRARFDARSRLLPWLLTLLVPHSALVQAYRPQAPANEVIGNRDTIRQTRRSFVAVPAGLAVSLGLLSVLSPAEAADVRESIAKAASKIPGYGQPDIFFPSWFEGVWDCTRECISVSTPKGEEGLAKLEPAFVGEAQGQVGERLQYRVTYARYGEEEEQGPVVAARGANAEALWRSRFASDEKLRRRVSAMWSPTNPNILTVSLPNGVIREVKVTKRGFEEPQPGAFGTSEYCRLADAYPDAGLNSVPKLAAVRVLTKYKQQSASSIAALELVQFYPTESLSLGEPEPLMVIKSRLSLTRGGQAGP